MLEKINEQGETYWEPQDPNDAGLLHMASGATFGETIFPSGWKSPKGKQVARDGKLFKVS